MNAAAAQKNQFAFSFFFCIVCIITFNTRGISIKHKLSFVVSVVVWVVNGNLLYFVNASRHRHRPKLAKI